MTLPIYSGSKEIVRVFHGADEISRVYSGSDLVFQKYGATGIDFNGTNYLQRASGLTGAADTNKLTFSCWAKSGADGGSFDTIARIGGLLISRVGGNRVNFLGVKSGSRLDVDTPANSLLVADGWVHILASFDLSDTSKRHIYLDGVEQTLTITTYDTGGEIVFTSGSFYVARSTFTSFEWVGSLADVWLDIGNYMDLSKETNRRKFLTSTGDPEYLGADGSRPTGTAPILFLGGRDVTTTNWNTNKGTGGDFTITGTLAEDSTPPSVDA